MALVVLALIAHGVALWSQQAINLDGSRSSLAPAAPQRVALELTIYYASSAALVAAYAALLLLVIRGRVRGAARTAVLLAPVMLQLALLLPRPWLSTDVLSYVAQGFLGNTIVGGNPYVNVPRDVLGTFVGDQLTGLGWRPQTILSPYGPLWTAYETLVRWMSQNVGAAVLLMKAAPVAASLGSAALISRILGRERPRLQLLGTVAFLWNPVVITELAAEGHVDGVMVFLVLLGVDASLRAQPVRSVLAGGLATMTKYLPLMLLPAQLVHLWRTRRPTDVRRRLLMAAALTSGLIVALFAPFWVGLRTLEGLRVMGQPGPWPTVTGFLYRYLERAYPWVDGGTVATIVVSGGFALYVLRLALGVRSGQTLLVALARTALAFVLVASPVFYPWYAVLPIALVALVPEASHLTLILVLTATSRLVAPLVDLRPAYEPIQSAAYTLTSLGLFLCIGLAIAFGLRAVWAWAASGHGESAAGAS